jgi:hypothetical protein
MHDSCTKFFRSTCVPMWLIWIQRGIENKECYWLCPRCTQNTRIYTILGFYRVEPYIQFWVFVLLCTRVDECALVCVRLPWGAPQDALYWPTTLCYKPVSIYSSHLQHGKLIWTVLIYLDCLSLHGNLSSCLRRTCKVGRMSDRPDPHAGDGWDPVWGDPWVRISLTMRSNWSCDPTFL